MNQDIKFSSDFTPQQVDFLRNSTNVVACKKIKGEVLGIIEFITTFALVSNIGMSIRDYAFKKRYCYPKNIYDLEDIIDILDDWNGKDEPPTGWVKYKGIDGERLPSKN